MGLTLYSRHDESSPFVWSTFYPIPTIQWTSWHPLGQSGVGWSSSCPRSHGPWLECSAVEQDDSGSIPALAKCFFSQGTKWSGKFWEAFYLKLSELSEQCCHHLWTCCTACSSFWQYTSTWPPGFRTSNYERMWSLKRDVTDKIHYSESQLKLIFTAIPISPSKCCKKWPAPKVSYNSLVLWPFSSWIDTSCHALNARLFKTRLMRFVVLAKFEQWPNAPTFSWKGGSKLKSVLFLFMVAAKGLGLSHCLSCLCLPFHWLTLIVLNLFHKDCLMSNETVNSDLCDLNTLFAIIFNSFK